MVLHNPLKNSGINTSKQNILCLCHHISSYASTFQPSSHLPKSLLCFTGPFSSCPMGCTLPTLAIPKICYFVTHVWLSWLFKGSLLSHLLFFWTRTNQAHAWCSAHPVQLWGLPEPKQSLTTGVTAGEKPTRTAVTSNILLFTNALGENIIPQWAPHLPLAHQSDQVAQAAL